jgi:hypothetical protein
MACACSPAPWRPNLQEIQSVPDVTDHDMVLLTHLSAALPSGVPTLQDILEDSPLLDPDQHTLQGHNSSPAATSARGPGPTDTLPSAGPGGNSAAGTTGGAGATGVSQPGKAGAEQATWGLDSGSSDGEEVESIREDEGSGSDESEGGLGGVGAGLDEDDDEAPHLEGLYRKVGHSVVLRVLLCGTAVVCHCLCSRWSGA